MFKTEIVIWTKRDPGNFELSDLAREAEVGEAYCSTAKATALPTFEGDPDWTDGATSFFGLER